jgi:hypothetical protein
MIRGDPIASKFNKMVIRMNNIDCQNGSSGKLGKMGVISDKLRNARRAQNILKRRSIKPASTEGTHTQALPKDVGRCSIKISQLYLK